MLKMLQSWHHLGVEPLLCHCSMQSSLHMHRACRDAFSGACPCSPFPARAGLGAAIFSASLCWIQSLPHPHQSAGRTMTQLPEQHPSSIWKGEYCQQSGRPSDKLEVMTHTSCGASGIVKKGLRLQIRHSSATDGNTQIVAYGTGNTCMQQAKMWGASPLVWQLIRYRHRAGS